MKHLFILSFVFCQITMVLAQDLNKLNAQGEKTGKWIVPYANSSIIRYEGQFDNGKPVGTFIFYSPDVYKQKELTYKNEHEAYAKFFDEIGLLTAEGKYLDEKRDSLWRFYKDGDLIKTEQYQMGKREGKSVTFFEYQRPAVVSFFKNDEKDSVEVEFNKEGKVISEVRYKQGKREGSFVNYFPDGQKEIEGRYQNGRLVGEVMCYTKNGAVEKKVQYNDEGAIDTVFHINSVYERFYEDGVMAESIEYRNGLKNGKVKAWYGDYEWIFVEEMDPKTKRQEVYRTLKNYHVKMEGQYLKGEKVGVFTYYNPDGTVKEKIDYSAQEEK